MCCICIVKTKPVCVHVPTRKPIVRMSININIIIYIESVSMLYV